MPVSPWTMLIVACIHLAIGALVFFRAKKNWATTLFLLYIFFTALWSTSTAFFALTTELNIAIFWAKTIFIAGSFIPYFVYCFSRNFPVTGKQFGLYQYLLLAIPPLSLDAVIIFTTWFIISVDPAISDARERIIYGPAAPIFGAYFFVYILMSFLSLQLKYRQARSIERLQISYALQAIILVTALTGITNVILPAIFNVHIFSALGPFFSLLFDGITAYAIMRHRLFNMEIIIKRSIFYAALIGVILALYLIVIFVIDTIFQSGIIQNNLFLTILIMAVCFTAITFAPLEQWVQRVTARVFFKGKYDYRRTLQDLGRSIGGVIELDELLHRVSRLIQQTIKVDRVFFFIHDRNTHNFILKNHTGHLKEQKYSLEKEPLLQYMSQLRRTLVQYGGEAPLRKGIEWKKIWEEMNRWKAKVCIPLLGGDQILGILCLGEKLSGDVYTSEDINLFDTFHFQLGTAIENAYLHQETLEKQRQIEKANRMATIGTMTAGLAHEIKNPMVALKTFAEILPKKFDDANYRRKYMEIVPKEVDRINNLLEKLLQLSRPTSARMERVGLVTIIAEVDNLLRNKFEQQKISLKYSGDQQLYILADRAQMSQLFLNLYLNAIQFMPQGGTLSAEGQRENSHLKISIKDTGIGIPAENLPRLFDPFFTTRHEGTGLGLTICQKIVEDHKGTIKIESRVGQGTTVILRFPPA